MTSESATRFSLSETGQWWIVAGILFGLDLLVPFAAGGRASFHYAGSVPFNLVLAAGLIIAGVLLQALPFARFGTGMAIAMTAVIDCDLIGNLARLTTPDRAYGVGFWILGVSAIIATVATIVAFRRLRAEGQLELEGGGKASGWVAAGAVLGLLVAVGQALPQRVATVMDVTRSAPVLGERLVPGSLGSVTLRGGLDSYYWSGVLFVALLMAVALVFPVFAGLMRSGWIAAGVLAGTSAGFAAFLGSSAVQLGAVSPATIGYTTTQISYYQLTANVTPAPGFYLSVIGVLGLAVLALMRGVASSEASDLT